MEKRQTNGLYKPIKPNLCSDFINTRRKNFEKNLGKMHFSVGKRQSLV